MSNLIEVLKDGAASAAGAAGWETAAWVTGAIIFVIALELKVGWYDKISKLLKYICIILIVLLVVFIYKATELVQDEKDLLLSKIKDNIISGRRI